MIYFSAEAPECASVGSLYAMEEKTVQMDRTKIAVQTNVPTSRLDAEILENAYRRPADAMALETVI